MPSQSDFELLLTMGAQMSASYQAVMRAAAAQLKGVGKAAEDANSASGKLRATISDQESKLAAVRSKYIDSALASGKNSKQTRALKKEYDQLNKELKKSKKTMSDAESGLESVDKGANKAKGGITAFNVALGNLAAKGVQSLISGMGKAISSLASLPDNTRAYRQSMIRMESAMQSAGYSASFAQEQYDKLYRYIGDSEATSNVLTTFSTLNAKQETMQDLVEGLTSAYAAMGGSVPVETLSESIEETIKSGEVTGELENALRRAGIETEDFNKHLSACSDDEERAQLVAGVLNGALGDQKEAYDTAAQSILDANDAQNKYEKAQGDLGEKIEPVTTSLKSGWAEVLQSFNDNILTGVNVDSFTEMIDGAFGWIADTAIPWVTEAVGKVPEAFDTLVGIGSTVIEPFRIGIEDAFNTIKGIFTGLSTWITGIFQGDWDSAVGGLQQAGQALWDYWEKKWDDIKRIFTGVTDWINDTFAEPFQNAFSALSEGAGRALSGISDFFAKPINKIIDMINWVIGKINGLSVQMPDWGGFAGMSGQTFGVNLPTIEHLPLSTDEPSFGGGTAGAGGGHAFADGGVVTAPTLALIGEGREDEAVLPLSKLDRLLATSSPSVVYSPTVNVTGGADGAQVRRALAEGYQEFTRYMAQYQREQRRTAFA